MPANIVRTILDGLTDYLNSHSEFFKNSTDVNVRWLYDTIKDVAAEARRRFNVPTS